jgi:Uma2 family endonuclease
MSAVTTQLLSAEDFFAWCQRPENRDRHFELERGKVIEVPRPGERYGLVCLNAGWLRGSYVRKRGRGYACANDTGIIWERDPDTVRGPDLVFHDDSPGYEELHPKYNEKVPQLAIEVLSSTDRFSKVHRRISQLLGWGVAVVWLIDPEDKTITVFRKEELPEVLESDQELDGGEVLPEFRCRVEEFFFVPQQPGSLPG